MSEWVNQSVSQSVSGWVGGRVMEGGWEGAREKSGVAGMAQPLVLI